MSAQEQTRTEITTTTTANTKAAAAVDADGVPLSATLTPEACPRRLDFDAVDPANDARTAAIADAFPFPAHAERRKAPRVKYQVVATLELDGDRPAGAQPGPQPAACDLHTRDLDERGAGFMSPHGLTPGQPAVLNLPSPDGTVNRVTCRVSRARPVAEGWFEGYVEFEGGQATKSPFSDERIAG